MVMAINLPQTIWQLFQIKLELLCQIAPAVFFGIHIKSISSKSILMGKNVNGLLVGGASLDSNHFQKIIKIADKIS